MQMQYKKHKMKDWFKMKQKRKKDTEMKNRHVGDFVKRQYRKYSGNLYLVNIYKKQDKRENS